MSGADPLTSVDDVRMLNIALDPASPAVGEEPNLDVTWVDPTGEASSWTWWCAEEDCSGGPVPPVPFIEVFGLACGRAACDGPGEELAHPEIWMAALPIEGVSLVRRRVLISPDATTRMNRNPRFTASDTLPPSAAPESMLVLSFELDDDETDAPRAFGYATGGGFARSDGREVIDGTVSLEWFAPEEPGTYDLYVVFEDGLGGSAVWTEPIRVQ